MLDLGATAKALAADRAAEAIAAELGCGVLVNLGGDIRVAGPAPEDGWRVGIADDVGFDGGPASRRHVVMIRTGGLATSGTAVRSWLRGSARLHHIIVRAPGCPRGRAGVRSAWPRRPAWTRTRRARRRSCAASALAAWLAGLGLPARLVRHDGTVETRRSGWPVGTGRKLTDAH